MLKVCLSFAPPWASMAQRGFVGRDSNDARGGVRVAETGFIAGACRLSRRQARANADWSSHRFWPIVALTSVLFA